VALAWPALARALGERFEPSFAVFAAASALPEEGGPLADGREFSRQLYAAGALPEEARLEVLDVDLQYARSKRGLRPRRGIALRVAWLRRARRLVLGVRLPWLGVRWLSIAPR
jgi:hypothetical protein